MKLFTFLVVATTWLFAVSTWAAPITVNWTHPTQWTDGVALLPADITHSNIWCTGGTANPGTNPVFATIQTVVGNGTSVLLDRPTGQWCAVSTIAKLSDGSLREGNRSAAVLIDPKRPVVPAGLGASVAAPILCSPGQVCPAP